MRTVTAAFVLHCLIIAAHLGCCVTPLGAQGPAGVCYTDGWHSCAKDANQLALYVGGHQLGVWDSKQSKYYRLEANGAFTEAECPYQMAAPESRPKPEGDDDRRLVDRLMPHIREGMEGEVNDRIERRLERLADEIKSAPLKSDGNPQAVGAILAAAIGYVVKKIIESIIEAALIAVLLALFTKYKLWFVLAVGAQLFVSFVTGFIGGRAARRSP